MSGFFDDIDEAMDAQSKADDEAAEAPRFDPNEGDELHGVLLEAKVYDGGQYPATVLLTFRNVGDEAVGGVEAGASGILFAPTVLRRKLFEAQPAIGTPFALRYEGKVVPTKGGNAYKDWTLLTGYMKSGNPDDVNPSMWQAIQAVVDVPTARTQTGQAAAPAGDDWKF